MSDNINITNRFGVSQWWYAFIVGNVASGCSISKVEIKSNGDNTWYECILQSSGSLDFYQCTDGTPYSLPISIRLTESGGQVIISDDLITSYTGGAVFDFGDNFDGMY